MSFVGASKTGLCHEVTRPLPLEAVNGPLDPQSLMSRRGALLKAGACLAASSCLSAFGSVPAADSSPITVPAYFWSQKRWVWLQRAATGEEIKLVYWANGAVIPEAYQKLSWFLRDLRFERMIAESSPVIGRALNDGRLVRNQVTQWALMDPIVLDVLYAYSAWLAGYGMSRPLVVTSGFRHFLSNELTEGAELAGWHPRAGAVDFTIPGVSAENAARFGIWLAGGGVGLYRSKNFTHVDRGRVRAWSS